jgi:hypothetical protein
MADQSSPTDDSVPAEAVADSLGGEYWFIGDRRWPGLSHDFAELLAPPIVVCTSPVNKVARRPPGGPAVGRVHPAERAPVASPT